MIFVFLLLARKSAEEKGDIGGKEKKCITIEKRIGGGLRWFIYTPVFTINYNS